MAWNFKIGGVPVQIGEDEKPPPTLRRGSTGEEVKHLQRMLGARADGIFGPNTEEGVEDFQERHGLQADGIVGPKTWASLKDGNR